MLLTYQRLHTLRCCRLVSSAGPKLQRSIRSNPFSTLTRLRGQILNNRTSLSPKLSLLSRVFPVHVTQALVIPTCRRQSGLDDDRVNKRDGDNSSVTISARRRRVGSLGRENEEERYDHIEGGIPEVSKKLFSSCSMYLLEKLYQRCLPLLKINDNMKVIKGDSYVDKDAKEQGIEVNDTLIYGPYVLIDLGPLDGQYLIVVDTERLLVLFQSPISGHLLYEYHPPTKTWINVQDGHNLEGIFVRDLCRKIKGYPNL